MIKTTTNPNPASGALPRRGAPTTPKHFTCFCRLTRGVLPLVEARLSQRVAMDDLASYFVEERSKVR
jgi:hypothetical protein